jgi:short subunit dehydrogenase-like uncharacterized protein
MTSDPREHDLVLYGATGFVGRLVARYLSEHAPAGMRVALAGRSAERLEQVRAGLDERARQWPVLVVDSGDPAAVRQMAQASRVVATTVGPYLRYGRSLVQACAEAGTHYADLTGEVLFVHDSIESFDATARRTGARIVHACGYDSVPSDLAVLQLHRRVTHDGEGELADVTLVATARGGFSGGTVDSSRAQVDAVRRDPAALKVLRDPYAFSPDRDAEPDLGSQRDPRSVLRDDRLGGWLGPFVMAAFNSRVVRRSNALQGWAYGRSFRYRELAGYGRGVRGRLRALGFTTALGLALKGLATPRLRPFADRLLPSPGDGPSPEQQAAGWFRMRAHATTTTGASYRSTVGAPGDPGYAATAVMFGESALALAEDEGRNAASGVLTPATALGESLADRLRRSGFELSVERL